MENVSCDGNVYTKRKPRYTNSEKISIIDYIVEKKAYSLICGNSLWENMENDKVCRNRSWQSLKEHFRMKILPCISNYPLRQDIMNEFLKIKEKKKKVKNKKVNSTNIASLLSSESDSESFKKSENGSTACASQLKSISPSRLLSERNKVQQIMYGRKGWQRNAVYYTHQEDLIIVHYVLKNMRYYSVRGNTLWKNLEKRNVLVGRTFYSLKGRFDNIITKQLHKYNLSKEEMESVQAAVKRGLGYLLDIPSFYTPIIEKSTLITSRRSRSFLDIVRRSTKE